MIGSGEVEHCQRRCQGEGECPKGECFEGKSECHKGELCQGESKRDCAKRKSKCHKRCVCQGESVIKGGVCQRQK